MEAKRYFSLATQKEYADIYIFGDITSWPWLESDVSSYNLAMQIASLDVPEIRVFINSYGGETAEALAIHNTLLHHPAKVVTCCDGMACSAAELIFMAGDERYMFPASLLMIHNAWQYTAGNADELRKTADDLEIISDTAANVHKGKLSISDEDLARMLSEETFISPQNALQWGFATAIVGVPETARASQSVRQSIARRLMQCAAPKRECGVPAPGAAVSAPNTHPAQTPEAARGKPQQINARKTFFNFWKENRA